MKLVSDSFAGVMTTAGRVVEATYPADQRLFDDPLALKLLPWGWRVLFQLLYLPGLRDRVLALRERRIPGVLGALLCRTRYIDDVLCASIAEGVAQVVILGAGFDTRAYRIPGIDRAHVYEVDLPGAVRLKQRRIEAVLGAAPDYVTFVAIDFERQTLSDVLGAAGFRSEDATLFIWEGVTQYLAADAVEAILRFIAAASGIGSALVFTYIRQGIIDGSDCSDVERRISAFARSVESPWVFGLDPEALGSYMTSRGLDLVEDVGADEYRERYLVPVGRDLTVFSGERTALARVIG